MKQKFQRFAATELLLPGRPIDYIDNEVWEPVYKALLSEKETKDALRADEMPLPIPSARENYFGDRHLEYWLSGYENYQRVWRATGLGYSDTTRVLDFGGNSGRVLRHIVSPSRKCYLTETNLEHVRLSKALFGNKAHVIAGHHLPPLPLPDNSVDLIMAFSVMTHISEADVAWLVEFDRLLAPGGMAYFTIHDEATWKLIPGDFFGYMFNDPEFSEYYKENPELTETVAFYYSDNINNNCNVFHSRDYIYDIWGSYFEVVSIQSRDVAHQASVVLKSRKKLP